MEASLLKTSMAVTIVLCSTLQWNTTCSCNYATRLLTLPREIKKILLSTRICLYIHLSAVVLDTNVSWLQNKLLLFHENTFLMARNTTNRRSRPSSSNQACNFVGLNWVTSLYTLAQSNHQTFSLSLLSQTLLWLSVQSSSTHAAHATLNCPINHIKCKDRISCNFPHLALI